MKRILMAGSALALLTLVPLSAARADCAAAPVATSTDLVISFLTANTTQAAPASLYASPIKKGMLLYDGTANTFKYCDGTNWVSMLSTGTAIPASGSGSEVQFRNTATGALDSDSTFVYDKTNHRLGVGTNNPQWTFSMASDTDPSIVINGYSNTAATGIRLFSGRDGSSGTTKLVNGSELGRIAFSGFYDGKAQNYFVNGDARAHIAVAAAEDWTGASNTGTRMGFGVTPIGGSAAVTRMTLDSSGSLGIGIGTPNASALLDLTSTSKGLLPPRMGDPTTAITSPAEGLMAYDSTNHALKIFNGTSWGAVGGGVAGSGDAGYVQLSDGSGGLTSDSTSGGEFFWDTSNHRLGIGTASPSQALSVAGGGIKLDNAQELYWRNSGDTGDTAIMTLSGDTTILRGGAGTPTLQFQANTGTPIMSMLEDGKVGIGTAAPAADLQVRNDTATPTISIKNGADSSAQRATNFDFSFGAASARISSARAATATAGTNMRFSTEPDGDTGMVERMRIDVSGNIGIGTTTPKSLLDVAGGARVGADATCTAAKAGMLAWNSNTLQVCTDAGTFTNIATSAGGSSQWVNGTSGAIYYNGGNVGIGTTAPDTQLHIKTTAITNVSQLTLTNPVGGGISTGDIFLQSTHASGHSFGIGHIRDASGFSLRDLTAAGAPIRMIIDSSGNMGVGTETPAFQLTVSKAQNDATTTGIYNTDTGTGAQARYILNNGTANSYLTLSGSGFTSSAYYRANGTALLSDGAGVDIAASDAAGDLRFWTGGSNRRMTIQAGGNVGIGTTTPATPLEVAGAVLGGVSDATQGVLGFGIRYIGSDIINTFGSGYSTADTVIGYGVKPKTGAGGYVSSLPYGPLPRGALSLSNAFIFSNAAASTTATGTDIAMTERFRIDANGNVGIGTASPGSLLHVYGAGVAATVDASSGNANLVVNSLAGNRSLLALRKGGTNRWMVEADGTAEGGSNAGSDFKIHRYDDTGAYVGTVLSALRSSGYVGVGMTTAPQSRLDVNGGARVGADATCTAAKAGMLAWNANTLQVCTDAGTFTNIASSSGGSSQWVNGTSGTIYYNSGSVNIGTATPLGAGSLFNVYSAGTAVVFNAERYCERHILSYGAQNVLEPVIASGITNSGYMIGTRMTCTETMSFRQRWTNGRQDIVHIGWFWLWHGRFCV
ncbi:MAG: hypothetical protein H6866_02450 [Rhodospirillales bacterium]|nr:MAG: hypothetical protein H6866_02450 [Rhodospirillales bacterium]